MSRTITGTVKNGVVIPDDLLPEDARVEIRVNDRAADDLSESAAPTRPTPAELRRMPREQQAILAAAAEMADQDYLSDKELTGFDA